LKGRGRRQGATKMSERTVAKAREGGKKGGRHTLKPLKRLGTIVSQNEKGRAGKMEKDQGESC